jgi:hypothetical protein
VSRIGDDDGGFWDCGDHTAGMRICRTCSIFL